ncbi:uncharacterized protein LOC6583227 [Drosophila mojavensis]|uniref:Pyruvate kinase C-terminal domain-containing protein n=1 Tax=Drosophila mojavensis TaxID=7230 RepID=B4KV37_DROMO|nr:uncharacterized protein LOC6583227 [Drosophila mojavensis]EDW19377.1 uncharacterized protein Dmoj_GI11559 [Drosophila mojavensis]
MSTVSRLVGSTRGSQIEVYENIWKKLKIATIDVDKVLKAKELLAAMQRRKAFRNLFGLEVSDGSELNVDAMQRLESVHSLRKMTILEDASTTEDVDIAEEEELSEDICQLPFDEERWGNFFTDFEILGVPEGVNPNGNNQCIELGYGSTDEELNMYLQTGVRCFLVDLFRGPLGRTQDLVVRLRETEIAVSKEYGFPVVSTIIAKLSPRHQYSGYLAEEYTTGVKLCRGERVTLTTDRDYSLFCTSRVIYVNARFLLVDIQKFDIILVGEDIQLMVRTVRQDHLICCVCREGTLESFMPVLFPQRCSRYRVSYEEVEDLTFSREVGINVVISNIVGTVQYVNDLERVMTQLQCDGLRLYARVVINDIKGCDGEMNWVAQHYDGLLVELSEPPNAPDILQICPDAQCILQLTHAAKKPIIFNPWHISQQRLHVDPEHYYHVFFYPDKYLVRSDQYQGVFYFSFLQSAIFDQILPMALSKMPLCDSSHTGADGMARAVVTASMEANAAAIVICGVTTRMVQKVAHFRPKTPILFVSHMRSAEDYVSLYHNVTMLPFRTSFFTGHQRNIYSKSVFALAYLASRKSIKDGDKIILVYNYATGTTFPEKYLIYTFDKKNFVSHLGKSLFPQDAQCDVCPDKKGIFMCTH